MDKVNGSSSNAIVANQPLQMEPLEKEGAESRTNFEIAVHFLLTANGTLVGVLLIVIAAAFHLVATESSNAIFHATAQILSIVFAEFGAVFLTVSLLHFAYDHFIRVQHEEMVLRLFKDAVREEFSEEREAQMLELFKKAVRKELSHRTNLEKIVEAIQDDNDLRRGFGKLGATGMLKFTTDKLSKELSNAHDQIRILKTWFPEEDQLRTGFQDALQRPNVKIELLLCSPDNYSLAVRSRSAHVARKEAIRKIINAFRLIYKVRCQLPDPIGCLNHKDEHCNTKIGLYQGWPGCPVIWCDKRIFLGSYFLGLSSQHAPWIRVKAGSQLATLLDRQFTQFWNDSRTTKFESPEALDEWLKQGHRRRKPKGKKQRQTKPETPVGDISAESTDRRS